MEADLYEEINGMIQLYLIRHSMTAGNLKNGILDGRMNHFARRELYYWKVIFRKIYIRKSEGICKSHEALHGNSKIDFQRKLL